MNGYSDIYDEKVNVVYDNISINNDSEPSSSMGKYGTVEPAYIKFVRDIQDQQMKNRDEGSMIQATLAMDKSDREFTLLADEIKKCNEKEISNSETFVKKIETMMEKFSEFENLEKLYEGIMKKLPAIKKAQSQNLDSEDNVVFVIQDRKNK